MTTVLMLSAYGANQPGDVCGFADALATQLIAAASAVAYIAPNIVAPDAATRLHDRALHNSTVGPIAPPQQ